MFVSHDSRRRLVVLKGCDSLFLSPRAWGSGCRRVFLLLATDALGRRRLRRRTCRRRWTLDADLRRFGSFRVVNVMSPALLRNGTRGGQVGVEEEIEGGDRGWAVLSE